jgi:hypothetical protein
MVSPALNGGNSLTVVRLSTYDNKAFLLMACYNYFGFASKKSANIQVFPKLKMISGKIS